MQALVGPNASGKTTFFDVIGLLSDLIRRRGDVREAVLSRSASFEKLIWQGAGRRRCIPACRGGAYSCGCSCSNGGRQEAIRWGARRA